MKIAIIVNPMIPVPPEQYGGIERIVYILIQELKKNGHDITLYAHEQSRPNCKLVAYSESRNYSLKDLVRINLLTSKIAFQNFDIVHTFGRMSNIGFLMLHKMPKIVSYQLPPTLSQIKKAKKIARQDTLHFTACSNFIAKQICTVTNATTIYNGVDVNDYLFKSKVPDNAPLAFLGRIQQEKGTDIAIKIALKTNQKLIIAGNIPAEKKHQQYFNEEVKPFIDQDRVKYIGAVNDSEKNELLRNARAMLMPVTWDEPFGIVMAEALACGTPVIGFNRGAIPEVITNGLNGFTGNTIDELAEAVSNISGIKRHNCRLIAEERFSATVLAKQYEQLYMKVTAQS